MQSTTFLVVLYTLKDQLNTIIPLTLGVVGGTVLVALLCYLLLKAVRCPASRIDVGAGVWAVMLLACLTVGYTLNKTKWYPDFGSLEGILSNVLVTGVFFLLGLAAWYSLLKLRAQLVGLLSGLRRLLRAWVVISMALYWLLINTGFSLVNAQTVSQTSDSKAAGSRVVLLGIDGATWKVMEPLLQEGKLPNIKRLMDSGTYGPLVSLHPTLSPIIWTTIATGKPMSAHGITHFVTGSGHAEGKLLTSNMRRVKALWNILSEHQRSVGVVGWFVTWPAEPVNGFMVSSYTGLSRGWKGRLQKDIPQQTFPDELIDELEPLMDRVEGKLESRFQQIFRRLEMQTLDATQQQVVEDTREVLFADMLNTEIGLHLYQTHKPDFFALYLGGTDVAGHRFWKYLYPKALPFKVTPEHIEMLHDVLLNYYLFADEAIGRILAAIDTNTLVVLISDHGMEPYIPLDGNDDRTSGHHGDAPAGVIVLSGQGVRRGPLSVPASVYNIAPTVLYALGLPLAEDMTAQPVLGAFTEDFVQQRPPAYIPSYESGKRASAGAPARESDVDELLKKRLKSLGYIN